METLLHGVREGIKFFNNNVVMPEVSERCVQQTIAILEKFNGLNGMDILDEIRDKCHYTLNFKAFGFYRDDPETMMFNNMLSGILIQFGYEKYNHDVKFNDKERYDYGNISEHAFQFYARHAFNKIQRCIRKGDVGNVLQKYYCQALCLQTWHDKFNSRNCSKDNIRAFENIKWGLSSMYYTITDGVNHSFDDVLNEISKLKEQICEIRMEKFSKTKYVEYDFDIIDVIVNKKRKTF